MQALFSLPSKKHDRNPLLPPWFCLLTPPPGLQGDEEGKHRLGFGHGRQEAEGVLREFSGPRPDGEGRSGASQPGGETFDGRPLKDYISCRSYSVLCLMLGGLFLLTAKRKEV